MIKKITYSFLSSFSDVDFFEIGIFLSEEYSAQEKMIIRKLDRETILSVKYLKYLQAMNANHHHIYIRPAPPHSFSLVDDVIPEKLGWAESEGLEPSVVIETSPGNYQLWLNHGQILNERISTEASKLLAKWFDGDPSSADFRHFGRFPGFTNPKKKYITKGLSPYSKLQTSRKKTYSRSGLVIETATQAEKQNQERANSIPNIKPSTNLDNGTLKSWHDFYLNDDYAQDCNRVDFAFSLYAISNGMDENTLYQILSKRDLSHKGTKQRQEQYLLRTISKARDIASKK